MGAAAGTVHICHRALVKCFVTMQIERNALAILKDPNMKARLSRWEQAFAERCELHHTALHFTEI